MIFFLFLFQGYALFADCICIFLATVTHNFTHGVFFLAILILYFFLARRNTNGNSYWSLFWLLAWWFFILLSHCLHMQLTYYFTSNCVTDSMLQSVFSIFHIFYHCLWLFFSWLYSPSLLWFVINNYIDLSYW